LSSPPNALVTTATLSRFPVTGGRRAA
jgi:hypothetical protein